MVRTDLPVLLYQEDEYTGKKTYAIAVFEDIVQHTPVENHRKKRIVHVLNEKNTLSSWIEEFDPYFGHWGKFSFGEFFDHGELMDAAWTTDGSGII